MQARWAKSLGKLEGTHQEAWGTSEYTDRTKPCVFFGLYDLRDYIALWRHKGKAYVLWAGGDLRNLKDGFCLNDGKLKLISGFFGNEWLMPILKKAEHYVENERERVVLAKLGISSIVVPSFMGRISDYKVSFSCKSPIDVYLSANEGRQVEYGFLTIEQKAKYYPDINFHLYGASWETKQPNVIVHGRVPKEQMNKEIIKMASGLRLNKKLDGFSEITAKSVLWGQWPIVLGVKYPAGIMCANDEYDLGRCFKKLREMKKPNFSGRDYYVKHLNKYPWCETSLQKGIKDSGRRGK